MILPLTQIRPSLESIPSSNNRNYFLKCRHSHQSPLLITADNTEISQMSTGECSVLIKLNRGLNHKKLIYIKSHLYDMFIKAIFDGYHMIKTQTEPEDTRMRKVS